MSSESRLEFAMWANEQALVTGVISVMSGCVGLSALSLFPLPWVTGLALVVGLLTCVLEYPRGARHRGGKAAASTQRRPYQSRVGAAVACCGCLTANYYLRFVLYVLVAVPLCLTLPTVLAALCYLITAAIYFVAAYRGEAWRPIPPPPRDGAKGPGAAHGPTPEPPKHPPPRPQLPTAATRTTPAVSTISQF